MRNIWKVTFLLCGSIVFAMGCASGPALDKYPSREIDRPYTLPKGVAAWHVPASYSVVSTNTSPASSSFAINPLVWQSALSDDWNLIWFPVPLGVSHQFMNTEKNRLGFTFVTGVGYGSYQGWFFSPALSVSNRY